MTGASCRCARAGLSTRLVLALGLASCGGQPSRSEGGSAASACAEQADRGSCEAIDGCDFFPAAVAFQQVDGVCTTLEPSSDFGLCTTAPIMGGATAPSFWVHEPTGIGVGLSLIPFTPDTWTLCHCRDDDPPECACAEMCLEDETPTSSSGG